MTCGLFTQKLIADSGRSAAPLSIGVSEAQCLRVTSYADVVAGLNWRCWLTIENRRWEFACLLNGFREIHTQLPLVTILTVENAPQRYIFKGKVNLSFLVTFHLISENVNDSCWL